MELKNKKALAYIGLFILWFGLMVELFVEPNIVAVVIGIPLALIGVGLLQPILWHLIERY